MNGVQMSRCLICYSSDTIKSAQSDSVSEVSLTEKDNLQNNQSVISKHLNVIFILKTVFELPSSDLSDYLRNCPNVENWVCICNKCEQQIHKCKLIFNKILKFTKKLQGTKQSIVEVVKSNYSNNDGSDYESEGSNVLDIMHKCRRFINQHDYRKTSDPFIEGDAKAKQLAVGLEINSSSSSSSSQFCSVSSSINTSDIIVKNEIDELNFYYGDKCEDLYPADGTWEDSFPADGETFEDPYPEDGDACEDLDSGDADWEPTFLKPKQTAQSSESENEVSLESTPTKEKRAKNKPEPKIKKPLKVRVRSKKKMSYHEKKLRYKCRHCEKEFPRLDHLKRHERIHEESMECDLCPRFFRSVDKLTTHKRHAHKIGPGLQGRSDNDQAEASLTGHEETSPLTHSEIAASVRKGDAKDDNDTKDADQVPRCNICNKTYYNTSTLYRHQLSVHGMCTDTKRKRFYCEFEGCGKILESASALRLHMSYHEKKPGFKCRVCGEEFYRGEHFKQHERTHGFIARMYECEICSETFDRKDKLKEHRRHVHRTSAEDSESENEGSSTNDEDSEENIVNISRQEKKQSKCQICGKEFHRLDHLKRHELIHEVTMECDLCPRRFRSIDKLTTHKRHAHKIGPGSAGRSDTDQAEASITDRDDTSNLKAPENAAGARKVDDATDDYDTNDADQVSKCNICNKTYYNTSTLYRHELTVHGMCTDTKRKRFYCEFEGCGKILDSAATLRTHMSYHEKKPEFKCQVCGKEFYRGQHFKRHQRAHGSIAKMYECEICSQKFDQEDKLKAHRRLVHSSSAEDVQNKYNDLAADGDIKPDVAANDEGLEKKSPRQSGQEKNKFKCQLCGKEFQRLQEQKRHERVHLNSDGRFQCDICPKHFRHIYHLNIHKNLVHTTNTIEPMILDQSGEMLCTVNNCNTTISSHELLELHLKTKHPEKGATLKCSKCGKQFYTQQAMRTHTEQHERERKEKAFICEHCGSAFANRHHLNSHKRGTLRCKLLYQNESEATIVCDQCGKKFGNQYNLTMHINRVHLKTGYKFDCEHCGKKFSKGAFLRTHLFKKHNIDTGEVKYWKCHVKDCGKVFFKKGVMGDHMSQHKGEPKYTCEECGKQFYFSGGYRQHMIGMHQPREKAHCDICGKECISKFHLAKHKSRYHKKDKTLLAVKREEFNQQLNADEVGD